MLNSKQRAILRSMANKMDSIIQVGKGGMSENLVATVSDALEARELIKMRVLENSGETARGIADALAEATGADVVSVVGTKLVLYRESKKKKKIFAEPTESKKADKTAAKKITAKKSCASNGCKTYGAPSRIGRGFTGKPKTFGERKPM